MLWQGLGKVYCARNNATCWPSMEEVAGLAKSLDPTLSRKLVWSGPEHPRVGAVPVYSPEEQPLYGLGRHELKAVYTDSDYSRNAMATWSIQAFQHMTAFCNASVRNNPSAEAKPAITVYALNSEHVIHAVKFAAEHNLCISVAGTGHDFMQRHSCKDSLLIRTTLMKSMVWGEDNETISVGPGIVFSELHFETSKRHMHVSSGWGITVGVPGWSTGGGQRSFCQRRWSRR